MSIRKGFKKRIESNISYKNYYRSLIFQGSCLSCRRPWLDPHHQSPLSTAGPGCRGSQAPGNLQHPGVRAVLQLLILILGRQPIVNVARQGPQASEHSLWDTFSNNVTNNNFNCFSWLIFLIKIPQKFPLFIWLQHSMHIFPAGKSWPCMIPQHYRE